MRRSLLLLEPKTPFVCKSGRALDMLPRSDTLSAAVVSMLRELGVDLEKTAGFFEAPPYRVSSGFPVLRTAQGDQCFLFVPDILRVRRVGEVQAKALKKVVYAEPEWIQAALEGREQKGWVICDEQGYLVLKRWPVESKALDEHVLVEVRTRQGVSIDRRTNACITDMLFETFEAVVRDRRFKIGVIVSCDERWSGRLRRAFELLGMCGLGPKRSVGRGKFVVEDEVRTAPERYGKGAHLLLSVYHPKESEWQQGILKHAWYRLEQRGGFVTQAQTGMTLRRCPVNMVTEGSLFCNEQAPEGEWVTVLRPGGDGPDDPRARLPFAIYRDGQATTVEVPRPAR